ncbi:monovalent cation/H+ antiporter subunit D family protein [Rhodoferax sp.]|uniref:monovalent cation/H+ antiporter subunit D family protein n=1 Tax=Rhodoferax sp. TaxID=50421 RepID=UPI002732E28A|nr:monovalent cation/H+ antiporter subunit D family protein [Rhodoferax sp.]MDP3191066.1 monovalent cation/H+ antiporter subunit D family protein [Rhodoferax sp.]MDP3337985.1 monovalent cation/H+ antiporter subunit D family protein [Rhodoferax sp.]MDP3865979.1 monovalent cation/H+ antiporter subunit D family protein [Rhodoferax sp.]
MLTPEQAILASMAVPLAGALLISLAGRLPNLRETITLVTAAVLLVLVLTLLPLVLVGARPNVVLFSLLPGLSIAFQVEPLGMLFALIASGLWIVNSLYSIGYMRGNQEANQTRFFVCFAVSIAATMGIAFSGNLLTLFIFYEVLTLSTYPLVTHHGTDKARDGGRIYLGLLLSTSTVLLLPALVFIWHIAGTTDFTVGGILADKLKPGELALLLGLCVFGIGKAALMPFHRWLPAAMVAPTPVSALLHAVAVVKAGVFSVVKVMVYVFGVDTLATAGATNWLVVVAGFTIIAASVVALSADNLKRRLAYSTVSQLSYVTMAAALLAPLSLVGAVMHIAAHAVGKITLFFAAGAIYTAAHKTEISQLDGIGRRMPWTMGAFAIAALSMIGLPPAVGFISKWYMVSGAMASQHWLAVTVIVLSTLLNAGYFLPIVYRAFFVAPPADPHGHPHGEAPLPMVIALTATATVTVLLFFFPDVPLALARQMLNP